MSAMKLTVGIPTFNRAAWLRETIASVLAQTFASFRLIVSDNASDDNTPEVVGSFGDERIEYVRSERNLGRIGNLNRLIRLADTEFLVLLPDDDVLYPSHLEAAIAVLEHFETVGLVHSAFDVIDAQSDLVRRVNPVMSRSPMTIARRGLALEHMMASSWPICFSSVVYRTKAIVDAGRFREEEEPFGDLKLWMRIALDWDFGYISKPLAGFRDHPESATTNIETEPTATSDGRELDLLFPRIRFQRRMSFLDEAPLDPRDKRWLSALAALELLVERSRAGLRWGEVVAHVAKLVRTSPRIVLRPELRAIVLRPELWRRVLVRLGARRVRSAVRGASTWQRRLRQG